MNVPSKFLSNPQDLGVVAVGFSGGQVRASSALLAGNQMHAPSKERKHPIADTDTFCQ